MKDNYGRDITYMRISVTDLCNLRCLYCMPDEGVSKKTHEGILSFEEIEKAVAAAAMLGIHKFRITGGEPLVRKGIVALVKKLSAIDGVKELVMTTNGLLLGRYAKELKEAGLDRVNISLDSLVPEKFAQVTRGGNVEDVLEGIEAAKRFALCPKLNVVLMRGFNDNEISDFVRFATNDGMDVRFIEMMPVGRGLACPYTFMSAEEARQNLPGWKPCEADREVAEYYTLQGSKGRVGFISPISRHFCADCNKIRLTPDGKIKTCLHSEAELDIRSLLRTGEIGEIKKVLAAAVATKEERHLLQEGADPIRRNMNRIGG